MRSKSANLKMIVALIALVGGWATSAMAVPWVDVQNALTFKGDGTPNPNFKQQIKSIMIFQVGGWSGLPVSPLQKPNWPLHWGRAGYLSRDMNTYLWQTYEISQLSQSMALAPLLMPDEEASASGYGVCWGGSWEESSMSCKGGKWRTPMAQLPEIAYAAWVRGVQVVPFFSINNYDCLSLPSRGDHVLDKLKKMVETIKAKPGAIYARTSSGQLVIMLEGLPENTQLSATNKKDLLNYMASETGIFWIDNLVGMDDSPKSVPPNFIRSAAANPDVQANLKSIWNGKYLWHFSATQGGHSVQAWSDPTVNFSEDKRLMMLNISPNYPENYPVIISQWNEYAEWLIWEPNLLSGYDQFNYLRWRLSQQP